MSMQETKTTFEWPLMKDCITAQDRAAMVDFVKNADRFTNGPKVKKFEEEWSEWLGCKHSLFVSSGSTANLLLVASIMEKYGLKSGDKVLVPSMTWVTNISPVIQLGLVPVFCDVDPNTYSFDLDHMKKLVEENCKYSYRDKYTDIRAVFVSHLFGIPADIDAYREILPNAIFMEDVCESHGATYKGKKCGTLAAGSTFSFYFGHHMTTIEGGFVCTDDDELYNIMKMKRSHGLAREATKDAYEQYKQQYPDIHPMFMFITDGYNLRSMELNAVLGSSQIKRLDQNNKIRVENYHRFAEIVNQYPNLFREVSPQEGNSSFCLPFVCNSKDIKDQLEAFLQQKRVETRPLCSGNLLRQPFLKEYANSLDLSKDFRIVEELHDKGFFIGNNHLITEWDWVELKHILEQFDNEQK